MAKKVSVSELIQYSSCKRLWYIQRVLKKKGTPFLPFIIGSAVHHFVAYWMYREVKTKEGVFYKTFYKSVKSAKKGFGSYWVTKAWPPYESYFNEDTKWWAMNEGKRCVENYANTAEGRESPSAIEERLSMYVPELGCTLVGFVDQIRSTNPKWAKSQKIASPGEVLIDLKTGRPQYWLESENATYEDLLKVQTGLVNNVQPTMYYFLYHAVFGRYPDAFLFWFLGGEEPRIISTTRNEHAIENMFDMIRSFMRDIRRVGIKNFPKTADTYKCKFCRFWDSCWDRERPPVSIPFGITDAPPRPSGGLSEEPMELAEEPVQLEFNLFAKR